MDDKVREFLEELENNCDKKKRFERSLLEAIGSPAIVGDAAFWAERRRRILDKLPESDVGS